MAGVAGLYPADVRARVAAGLTAQLGARGWRESPYILLRLPDSDGIILHHATFAVGLGATRFLPGRQSRTLTPGRGVYAETEVLVRYLLRLRAQGEVGDYDAALGEEAAVVDALRAVEPDPGLTVTVTQVSRRDNPPGMAIFAGEVSALCHHLYPLDG